MLNMSTIQSVVMSFEIVTAVGGTSVILVVFIIVPYIELGIGVFFPSSRYIWRNIDAV